MIAEAAARSRDLLNRCVSPAGFVASASLDHYRSIWARDACIASLGALTTGEPRLIEAAAATIDTLVGTASPRGQVPAVVAIDRSRWDWAEGGVVDATAWMVVTVGRYLRATGDVERVARWWPAVTRGLEWLGYQDVTGSGLISAAPATDWMDASLTRSGRTLHLNALHVWAHREAAAVAQALGEPVTVAIDELAERVNTWFWPRPEVEISELHPHGFHHAALRIAYWQAGSFPRRHYLSHLVHAALVDRCDVLANLLAIVAGVADAEKTGLILDHLSPYADPYPTPSLTEPVEPGDPTGMLIGAVDDVIPPRWRNHPGRYHNGAIWPYIGGFHALASAVSGRRAEARELLERVARVNHLEDWAFPEWLTADGMIGGARDQAWNAGSYLLAFAALREAGQ